MNAVLLFICLVVFAFSFFTLYEALWSAVYLVKNLIKGNRTLPETRKRVIRACKLLPLGVAVFIGMQHVIVFASDAGILKDSSGGWNADEVSEEYVQAANSVTFEMETVNREYTYWEDIIDQYLYYDCYKSWTSEPVTLGQLRKKYQTHFGSSGITPSVGIEDIRETVMRFYGTEIFPETQYTLGEISNRIPDIDKRMNADPSIATEEFLLRVLGCDTGSTGEELYQSARAVDDSYKQREYQGNITEKERILLPSLAVVLYGLAQDKDRDQSQHYYSFASYRTGEQFLYIYEHGIERWTSQDYDLHFLLLAEAKLNYVKDTCPEGKDQDYLFYYLAKIQYLLIDECDSAVDGELIEKLREECMENCVLYIGSSSTNPRCITSCERFMEELGG